MIKLIATDMDGTFLDSEHKISEKNIKAVKYAKENNIEFVIASGRSFNEAMPALEEASIENCELICLNGGITYDKNHKIISIVPLEITDAKYIINTFKKFDINYQLYTQKCVYTNNIKTDIKAFFDLIKSRGIEPNMEKLIEEAKERQEKGYLIEVENVDNHINEKDNPLIKIIGVSSKIDLLQKAFKELENNKNLNVTSSGINNIEVMNSKASKGLALKKLAKKHNIKLENTMALGDNLNDMSMLEISKYSVAMANANEEVKKITKFISKYTNDQSAVGEAIFSIVENTNNQEKINKELIKQAIKATEFSYSPYSNFKVGAAILAKNGKIYTGCNIENASYTPTNCAERTAIFKAVSEGITEFSKIAIVGGPNGNLLNECSPCGVCRQVIGEFATEDFEIILGNSEDNYKVYKFFKEIFPLSFTKKELTIKK